MTVSSAIGNALSPLFDVHPVTGDSIEVFYADRTLESFGRCGAGWFWASGGAALRRVVRRRALPDELLSLSPRDDGGSSLSLMMLLAQLSDAAVQQAPTHNVNTDTVRTRGFLL